MKLRFLCLCMVALLFIEQASVMLGQEVKRVSTQCEAYSSRHTGAAWLRRPCRNRDSFLLTHPVLRLISGTELEGRSRSSFSAIRIVPMSVRCTWRILARR